MAYTNIRIQKDQLRKSRKIRKAARGAQIGSTTFRTRIPTHDDVYAWGLEWLESQIQKGKPEHT